MIIISSRKFRESQQEYFRKALSEEVILTTVHHGCFRLVPIIEGETAKENSTASSIHSEKHEIDCVPPSCDKECVKDRNENEKIEKSREPQLVFVDPSLYDSNPEQYAKELEEEKRMIEELQTTGLRKLFRRRK